ncbi:MAG TPA: hypothetical protein VIM21_13580, partial [Gemmatimonadaceae bacterium]
MQAPRLRRVGRYRWPLSITFILGVAAAFSLSPLVDAVRPQSPVAASLTTSFLYDLFAPLSNTFDALTP